MDDRNKYNPDSLAHRAIAAKIIEKRGGLDSGQKAEVADAMNAGDLAKAQEILDQAR
jgi:hypothetical protein